MESRTAAVVVLVLASVAVEVYCGAEQQLQCYACGLPKVHPENDVVGSYGTGLGKKRYNHSCDELKDSMVDNRIDDAFLRTCPVGVKSCFGAIGFYDHEDNDPSNDMTVSFLGCSEAKYKHDYGCDQEFQNVDVRDKNGARKQVEIEVSLCFCNDHTCNHINGELLASSDASTVGTTSIFFVIAVASFFTR